MLGHEIYIGFNGHPPLGVNATQAASTRNAPSEMAFQRAPTLGGECYEVFIAHQIVRKTPCFNGHPPLGVNATRKGWSGWSACASCAFQRAPTLGGECYDPEAVRARWGYIPDCFNGHPPLGVNATYRLRQYERGERRPDGVSTGTHPWG